MIWNFLKNVTLERGGDTLNFASFNCGGVLCIFSLKRRLQSDNFFEDLKTDLVNLVKTSANVHQQHWVNDNTKIS
jgi:hypothetical protein